SRRFLGSRSPLGSGGAHARPRARVFLLQDLQAPPAHEAHSEGRFNHYGQSVFYLGGTQRAALRETVDITGAERVAWLQEFSLSAIENILDLRVKDWSDELAHRSSRSD